AAARSPLETEGPAVGGQDLGAEREPEAGAGGLRGGEGQERRPHRLLVHPAPAVEDRELPAVRPGPLGRHLDRAPRAPRFRRVLDEVDDDLLHLRGVEPARSLRNLSETERQEVLRAFEELAPGDLLRARPRQAREPRVTLEKAAEVIDALGDRAVDLV